MKTLLVFLILFLNDVGADELTRIESIVKDITKLKTAYADLELENKKYKSVLEATQNENDILRSDIKLYSNYEAKENSYKKKIQDLKLELKKVTTHLKNSKCSEIKPSNSKFPKLAMKKKYQKKQEVKVKKEVLVREITDDGEVLYFEASSFRVNKDAKIFDGIYGIEIDVWEKSTSFTSNQRTSKWIKITGYFIDKVWHSATKEMWVKATDADKR